MMKVILAGEIKYTKTYLEQLDKDMEMVLI